MNNRRLMVMAALVLGLSGLAATANAAMVLIDWSTATDISGSADTNGNFWNSFGVNGSSAADIPATALVDTSNVASGFNVAVNIDPEFLSGGGVRGASFGGNGISGPAGANPFDITGATTDGIFNSTFSGGGTTSAVVTFSNLAASTQYDLVLIGGRASKGEDGVISLLQGTSGSGSYNLLNDGTLLSFSATSTAAGIIELDFTKSTTSSTNGATWNAMSIEATEVPEPSSLATGLLGLTLMAVRRRK